MSKLTTEIVREFLEYNAETGEFLWRNRERKWFSTDRDARAWNTRYDGSVAGTPHGKGYLAISIFGRRYYSHRLAWFHKTGKWPSEQIDHMNGNRADNRFSNLRSVTNTENQRNQGTNSHNKSGYPGVSWHKRGRRWQAQIRIDRKLKHLGCFDTPEEAHAAYSLAASELGFSERHIYGRGAMTSLLQFSRQKSTELCAGATVFFLLGYQLAGAF